MNPINFTMLNKIVLKLRSTCFKKNFVLNYHFLLKRLQNNSERKFLYNTKLIQQAKFLSCSSSLMGRKTDVPETDKNLKKENLENALDDKEFKGILRDVSRDFEIGNETETLLDSIRKRIEKNNESKDNPANHSSAEGAMDTSLESHEPRVIGQDKFKEFHDKDATVIYSYEEELLGISDKNETVFHIDQEEEIKYEWQKAKRGVTGVFDIEELVEVIRKENLFDISVMRIPEELCYADYMVLATAKSPRHSKSVTEFIYKLYKAKKNSSDPFTKVEGEKVSTWKVMDMGNIVLHIFLKGTRDIYDIESLWLFDKDFDSGGFAPSDPMLQAIEEQLSFFNEMDLSEVDEIKTKST